MSDTSPLDGDRMCRKYADDIYQYHRQAEEQRRSVRITVSDEPNRNSLINELTQHGYSLKLMDDTLYLAASILDRYLSLKVTEIDQTVLVAGCLFVAAKFEETTELEAKFVCGTGNDVLLEKSMLEMEVDILESFKFDIWSPTTVTFLWRFTHMDEGPYLELEQLGSCLAELSLLNYHYGRFLPSMVAASVVFLGKFILNSKKHPWSKTLQSGTGYGPPDLKECILCLDQSQKDPKNRPAIRRLRHKFGQETSLPSQQSIPDDYFQTVKD